MKYNLIKMQEKFIKEKIQFGILFIFLALFLILVLISLFGSNQNQSSNTQKVVKTSEETFTILPVEDNKKIILGENTINLDDNYYVNTIYKKASLFVCSGDEDCKVYEITKGDTKFYLSDKGFTFTSEVNGLTDSEIVLTLDRGDTILNTKMMFVTNREFESPIASVTQDTQIPLQVYGCVEDNICVNSGIMSSNISENAVHLSDFIEFINSILR